MINNLAYNNNSLRSNKYDYLLIILIILQVFGILGGFFQPVRLFIIAFFPFIIGQIIFRRRVKQKYFYEIIFFIVFILYAFLSLLWVYHPMQSLKDVIYLFINSAGFFLLICFANKANHPQESIIRGWILFFILTLPVALPELWFDFHLPISTQEEGTLANFGDMVLQRHFASVTFGNLNTYNTILTYILPFLFCSTFVKNTFFISQLLRWILILLLCYIIVANSSRATVVCLILSFLLLLFYNLNKIRDILVIIFICIMGAFVLLKISPDFYLFFVERIKFNTFEDNSRSLLIQNGINSLLNSHLMGIGAGNFVPTMKYEYKQFLQAPHNLFLEVLVQYGLLIFILFLGLFTRIFVKLKDNLDKRNRFLIFNSFIILPFSSVINSGYLLFTWFFLFLASLYIISDKSYNTKK